MLDWPAYVRRNLRLRGFRPEREAEIVEEVARQLEDAYTEALRLGASEERAGEIARRHIVDWDALAHELEEAQRGKESAMTTWQHNAEDRALRERGRLTFLAGWRRRRALRPARAGEESRLHHRRRPDAGPLHRRQHRHFQHHQRGHVQVAAGARSAAPDAAQMDRPRHPEEPRFQLLWRLRQPQSGGANPHGCSLSKPFLEEVRQHGPFSSLAEFAGGGSITVSGNVAVHQANGQYVSGDYFQALGVGAAAGRVFVPADDAPGAAPVAVLQYAYWKRNLRATGRLSERRWI
jgi:hypothetical protein